MWNSVKAHKMKRNCCCSTWAMRLKRKAQSSVYSFLSGGANQVPVQLIASNRNSGGWRLAGEIVPQISAKSTPRTHTNLKWNAMKQWKECGNNWNNSRRISNLEWLDGAQKMNRRKDAPTPQLNGKWWDINEDGMAAWQHGSSAHLLASICGNRIEWNTWAKKESWKNS